MHDSDRLSFSKISLNTDYDSFFEEDDFQDLELDGEINEPLDATGLNEMDDYFWDLD